MQTNKPVDSLKLLYVFYQWILNILIALSVVLYINSRFSSSAAENSSLLYFMNVIILIGLRMLAR